mgnify:CR=1 FL=1
MCRFSQHAYGCGEWISHGRIFSFNWFGTYVKLLVGCKCFFLIETYKSTVLFRENNLFPAYSEEYGVTITPLVTCKPSTRSVNLGLQYCITFSQNVDMCKSNALCSFFLHPLLVAQNMLPFPFHLCFFIVFCLFPISFSSITISLPFFRGHLAYYMPSTSFKIVTPE